MEPYPVDDFLSVKAATDVYKTGRWWKAVVVYQSDDVDTSETAIYLWMKDEDVWTQKNKYIVKTVEAWESDSEVIAGMLEGNYDGSESMDVSDPLPVSDYYTVDEVHHVFQTDEWWKAIVRINKKGDFETTEVIIYLWQHDGDDWRRRQKYAIKGRDDWEEEKAIISDYVYDEGMTVDNDTTTSGPVKSATKLDKDLAKIRARAHLSDHK